MIKFQSKVFQKILIATLFCISIIWMFLGVYSPDDIAQNIQPATDFSSILTHWKNYRYFIVLISQPFLWAGVHYNEFMPLWACSLALGIVAACYAVLRYSNLSVSYMPYFVVMVTVHGYFTDLFYFPMSYSVFGFGFIFIGISILLLTRHGVMWTGISSVFVALSLMSYQPSALIILFASALLAINAWLHGHTDASKLFKDTMRGPIAFTIGSVLFLLSVKLFSDGTGRAVAPENIINNIQEYVVSLKEIIIYGAYNNKLYPSIQRISFFIVNISAIVSLILQFRRGNVAGGLLAFVALFCSFLIFPSPLNLFSDIFWPSPRSISSSVFFEVALIFVLFDRYRKNISCNIAILAFSGFAAVSTIHQMNVLASAKSQNMVDKFVAKQIIFSINEISPITEETKIAVVSTWENAASMNPYAFMDNGLSAFDTSWSKNAVLWLYSPVKYKQVTPPVGACEKHTKPQYWDLVQTDGIIVVFMK